MKINELTKCKPYLPVRVHKTPEKILIYKCVIYTKYSMVNVNVNKQRLAIICGTCYILTLTLTQKSYVKYVYTPRLPQHTPRQATKLSLKLFMKFT